MLLECFYFPDIFHVQRRMALHYFHLLSQLVVAQKMTPQLVEVPNVSKIVAPHGEGHFLKDREPDPV